MDENVRIKAYKFKRPIINMIIIISTQYNQGFLYEQTITNRDRC